MPVDKFGRSQNTSSQSEVKMSFISNSEGVDFEGKILKNIGESNNPADAASLKSVRQLYDSKIQPLINTVDSVQEKIEKVEHIDRYVNAEFVKMKDLLRHENVLSSKVAEAKFYRKIIDFIYEAKGELKNDINNLSTNFPQIYDEKIKKLDENVSVRMYNLYEKLYSTLDCIKREQKMYVNELNYLKDHVHALLEQQKSI